MENALKEKLEAVVGLVSNVMVNPDIDLEYNISDAENPYIRMKYMVHGEHKTERNIPIKSKYLDKTPEDIANLVTFYIEQFIEQINSVDSGAQ